MVRDRVLAGIREAVRRGREEGVFPAGEGPEPRLEVPDQPDFGDFTCSLALTWAREAERPPRRLASEIAERIPAVDLVEGVRVEGPGFLNLALAPQGFQEIVRDVLRQGEDCLRSVGAPGEDFEIRCPRVPEPRTLADGRREAAAAALGNLLEAAGHRVSRLDLPTPGHSVVVTPARGKAEILVVGPVHPDDPSVTSFEDLARRVGEGAARFHLLRQPMQEPVRLAVGGASDPSLSNPLVQVQYARVRASGVLRMGRDQGVEPAEDPEAADLRALGDPPTLGLIRTLEEGPWLVRRAAEKRESHRVPAFALHLAGLFHLFYNQQRILGLDHRVVAGRLALARAVQLALEGCCSLMGVDAPERT